MKIDRAISGNGRLHRDWLILLGFTALSLLIYFPVRHAGFVTDFIGFETNYGHCGFWHYYDCTELKSFRYLQHAFSYMLWKTVGSDSLLWYFLYCLAFAACSFFGYRILAILFERAGLKHGRLIAFTGAVIFLFSPYNTEVVVWKVCIQYMTVLCCLFLALGQFMTYTDDRRNIRILLVALLFVIGMLSLEQAVILPPALLLLGFLFYLRENDTRYLRFGLYFSLPLFLLTGVYFLLSKLVYGKWIVHYGSEAFRDTFSMNTLSNFYNYFFKHLILFRYWPTDYRDAFVGWLGHPVILAILTLLCLGLIGWLIVQVRKRSALAFTGLFLLLIYVIVVVPVMTLFFTVDRLVANDRVGFIPSYFVYTLFAGLVFHFFYRLRFLFFGAYLAVNAWYLALTIGLWRDAQHILETYASHFNFYEHKQVVVLGVPHAYHGVWMMLMIGENSGLSEVLQYRAHHAYTGQMLEVAQYNQLAETDALKVVVVNDSIVNVSFRHEGSWFDRNGVGLNGNDYENAHYRVNANPYGYEIIFRNLDKDHILIYPDSLRWSSLTLPKFK